MKKYIGLFIAIGIIVIASVIVILCKPSSYYYSSPRGSGGSSYNNNSSYTYERNRDVNLSSGSLEKGTYYYKCNGTVSVRYSSQNKYRYIKVKASFLDYSGRVVDTDWTYAVGSEWLEPGESSKFYASVEKDYSIASCKLSFMD